MDRVDEMGPQNLREITFPYRRLRYEDISRYPYVDKLSIPGWNTKNNPVSIDFIYQFATKSISYHCINDEKHCSCYVADIFGPPTVHLDDGCKKRTPNRSYSSFSNSLESNGMHYINLEYHEAVYPLRISVFGDSDFPVGFRSRIWAKDSDDKWSLLWDTNSDVIYKYKRTVVAERLIFSTTRPPYYFKTKMLRLEFTCSLLQLHSKLTAVMLAGTSDLIFPRRLEPSNPHCVFNLLDKINPCPCRPIQNYEFALNIITLESKNILQWKTPLIRFCLTKNVIQWNLWNYYVICER
ncbi:uncharacterized protein LOC105205607 [Solenopsis invicta]|uniref:uncharacterized protein LOC105205607 n=1 Tax=Solenopsis invicta TaxID=13686 RepID=UPI00193E79A4|nr:uncharacterized protein LOC105205607 [Solenopsis invicta]